MATDGEARYNITGTPTFILNGVNIGSGNIPFDDHVEASGCRARQEALGGRIKELGPNS